MRKGLFPRLLALLAAALALSACSAASAAPSGSEESSQPPAAVRKADPGTLDGQHLRDEPTLYANDEDTSVVTMYLTVFRGNAGENTDHSWAEVNTFSAYDYTEMGVERYQAAALLQVGDESGPLPGQVGYGETVPNATVQIRGQTSTRSGQKNYKIELKKGAGVWRGQRTIALNKHVSDALRLRNKLAYDLLEEIDELIALRTQFVHLYVRDTTGSDPDTFVDYGLYTQVEQLNKTALRAHGLDSAGYLYKINFFEFYRYEEIIRPADDPAFDRGYMDGLLETKGEKENGKLIQMLDAVNDLTRPIDEILDQYFDRENLCYWMAFEMLLGNVDTESRNVYLYSPRNGNKWYFIAWDHDAALMTDEWALKGHSDGGSWDQGVSNYWGNLLFQRALKSERFRAELDAAVEDLRGRLSAEHLAEKVAQYVEVVRPYAFSMPDVQHIGVTRGEYDAIAAKLPSLIEQNYQKYRSSLEKPMPFFVGVPQRDAGKLVFQWDPSYDFDAENITYRVALARDCDFQEVLFETQTRLPSAECADPGPGQYFLRVVAVNDAGQKQDCFDYYVTDRGKMYGMLCFYELRDGTVEVDQIRE